jgi:hypothetical protein
MDSANGFRTTLDIYASLTMGEPVSAGLVSRRLGVLQQIGIGNRIEWSMRKLFLDIDYTLEI